ncbi:MAG: DNA translocase FtsK, partial [Lachnospiraceae bacterium]|nr:DNA translocase FtsK [Lachnospiraceae bacterium]
MASNQGRGTRKSSSGTSTRKKTTTNRSNTGSRASSAKRRNSEPMPSAIRNEILLIVFLALAVILFLCNFGIVGTVGNAVSTFMCGIVGLLAYIAPVIIFLSIAFGMSNIGN